jgi:hypothetical protein
VRDYRHPGDLGKARLFSEVHMPNFKSLSYKELKSISLQQSEVQQSRQRYRSKSWGKSTIFILFET